MLALYFDLGKRIETIKAESKWGSGFSYVGRQQRIQVGEFKPEYVSKLGLYVSAVNHQLKPIMRLR